MTDDDTIADGKWLRSIGAFRPQAVASATVYSLGEWRADHGGCYPLLFNGVEERIPGGRRFAGLVLSVYGVPLRMNVTRGDVLMLCSILQIELQER